MSRDPLPIPDNLKEPERKLWEDYAYQISHGHRKTLAPKTMRTLINSLKGYSGEETRSWFVHFLEDQLDKPRGTGNNNLPYLSTNLKVPTPLFEEIVLSELVRGYTLKEPNYTRWLGQVFNQAIIATSRNPTNRQTLDFYEIHPSRLFEEALDLNQRDDLARYLLIENHMLNLDFTFHEEPRGVLGEKGWLDEMLVKLELLLKETGLFEIFRERLVYWRFHTDAWDDYLKQRDNYVNYSDYLAKHPFENK